MLKLKPQIALMLFLINVRDHFNNLGVLNTSKK